MNRTLALAGNPNVGKSTLFNSLTGLKQHTGNWAGKTVSTAAGRCRLRPDWEIHDLPGTYSLDPSSPEEAVARDFIISGGADAVVAVCDACCLQRNMNLLLQLAALPCPLVCAVNMMDEAEKKGISLNLPALSLSLGIAFVPVSAKDKSSPARLLSAAEQAINSPARIPQPQRSLEERTALGERLCRDFYSCPEESRRLDRLLDSLFCGRFTAYPLCLLLLLGLFYISIRAANYPSQWLMALLFSLEAPLLRLLQGLRLPQFLCLMLTQGAYRSLSWVTAVMLPPMAVFFPLFTFLEDAGLLPRLAYNLDLPLRKCGSCGRQALTMSMGFGCNAAAVTGCRIIDSKRERLAAMLTNAFIPCNGRFGALISLISLFFLSAPSPFKAALILTGLILAGTALSLGFTKLLTLTVLKGESSVFALELPPYRMPKPGQLLLRSLIDRCALILARAALVSAPAGALLWILANTGGEASLLSRLTAILDPLGRLCGMDGVILAGFLLGLPANEIVIPVILMAYGSASSLANPQSLAATAALLRQNGWTGVTALCVCLMFLCHPCSTAVISVGKETGRLKYALLSWALPTAAGLILCATVSALFRC